MINIIKTRPVCKDELLEKYKGQAAATLHEAMGRRGALDPKIKPLDRKMRVAGRALTVQCHTGDNIMLIKAISMAQPGDVIVANMGNAVNSGPFGEVLCVECITKKIAGMVFSGAVRDSSEIIEHGLPVFSSEICISGTAKATLGTINHPISIGGVIVNPGDIIVGDADGVVCVPLDEAEETIKKAEARVEKEDDIMRRLRAGESSFDIYGYQKVFDALGCTEEK